MDPTVSGRFLDFMKGVGDSVVDGVAEGAKGVYDFGQVAVGGSKALTKEGLNAVGATELAKGIEINDIEPVSSLGKIAAQGGYAGLGDAAKNLPGNLANGVTDAAANGDMRGLGTAVTNAVFAAEGARAGTVGVAKGAAKGASKVLSPKTVESSAAAAASKTAAAPPKPEVSSAAKAQAANAAAKQSQAQAISNKAAGGCDKKPNAGARDGATTNAVDQSLLPPPKKGITNRIVDSVVRGDGNYVHKQWGALNGNEYKAVREYMGRTEAGRKLLSALDRREAYVDFFDGPVESPYIAGMTRGSFGKVFMRNTEKGYYWDQLDIEIGGMERTAQIGLHEGLHALGVGGSRRAEALVRLEELRAMDVPIDRKAMRQVLSDMDVSYNHYEWLSAGRSSKYFPGLKF